MAPGLNLPARPGRILRVAGFFFQIALRISKMCSPYFHLAPQSVLSFSEEGLIDVNGLWEMLLKQFQCIFFSAEET